jgi:hypothetical protein
VGAEKKAAKSLFISLHIVRMYGGVESWFAETRYKKSKVKMSAVNEGKNTPPCCLFSAVNNGIGNVTEEQNQLNAHLRKTFLFSAQKLLSLIYKRNKSRRNIPFLQHRNRKEHSRVYMIIRNGPISAHNWRKRHTPLGSKVSHIAGRCFSFWHIKTRNGPSGNF